MKVPDIYLEEDTNEMKKYCKLVKFNQAEKFKKAVEEICRPKRSLKLKSSLSLKSKVFLPKAKTWINKLDVDEAVVNRKYSQENPIVDTSLDL